MNKDELILSSVHEGLVEAIILLRNARKRVNDLAEDKEIKGFCKHSETLGTISENLIKGELDISEIIGSIFFDRIEAKLD